MMDRQPIGPASAYQTYAIKAPISTHFRPATCEEVECPDYLYGWKVHLEGLPDNLKPTALNSGRRYAVEQEAAGLTWIVYEAGQKCFQYRKHHTRLERPELYLVRGGDARGNPTGEKRIHKRAEDWMDDLHEHTDKILDALKEG